MNHPFSSARLKTLAAAFLLSGLGISPVFAGLEWTQKTLQLKAAATDSAIEARFHFTNSGKEPLDIQQVESSCGCTTTALGRRHYAPGESGEIVATYRPGDHVGRQTKTILVKSNDSPAPVTLTLVVDIPEVLRIQPKFVFWTLDEEPKPKTVTLELMQDTPLEDITVQSSNAAMALQIQEVVKGRKYSLTVTPSRTDHTLFATVTINCRFGKDETKTFRTYATVRPAAPSID